MTSASTDARPDVADTSPGVRVIRVEVRPAPGVGDPRAIALLQDAQALGYDVRSARSARVYLIESTMGDWDAETIRSRLLEDPVTERAAPGMAPVEPGCVLIEVHPLPGVMDPAAQTVQDAIRDLVGRQARVSTGWRYDLSGVSQEEAKTIAERLLANPVVQAIHDEPHWPESLPVGHEQAFEVTRVPIRELDDAGLEALSRDGHLFLSLDEMRAIRDEYRRLEREPTDIELETLAQTWSEHCVHKTLKSTIKYTETESSRDGATKIDWSNRPGHEVNPDGSVTIHNLLKSTVAAATFELIEEGVDWTLSVFVDNAGIIEFDDETAVCVKVETHNHPSAIEPYGGAATGIGGCIRDIIGTGLAAKPIASTDVFCVAGPGLNEVPSGCLHPKRILTEVVAGVRDYGNRMGIPTVNGAVWFDDRYVGNPLVFCGCVGMMPRGENDAYISGEARPGDRIIALGGRTGRDGIHGATFSSAELTDTHADEFSHAVQIGNAIEEKRVLDAILRARDAEDGPLYSAITDCGAGGFSSAVGEMGEKIGAEVHLERAPLKYDGLTYDEIWISEAQERMVLSVPPEKVDALRRICDEEHVELADLGRFGTDNAELILNYHGVEVGRLSMAFLHDGIPTPTRVAVWDGQAGPRDEENKRQRDKGSASDESGGDDKTSSLRSSVSASLPSTTDALLTLLAHPNIASKHWIVRQYDHEVQGATAVTPLVGPMGRGPGDASVIEPRPGSGRGLAIACGLATGAGDPQNGGDPYLMALAAIDECVRNLVCVGADPDRIAILDNFCWPSCQREDNLATLVRAAEGCYDAAKAYRTPFISGKDSLNNQFTTEDGRTIQIPPTLLITGVGIVPDVERCVTMDLKHDDSALFIVEPWRGDAMYNPSRLGGSHYLRRFGAPPGAEPEGDVDPAQIPAVDLSQCPATARGVARAIARGLVASCHDCSDGGPLVALAEMLIAGSTPQRPIGAWIAQRAGDAWMFSERPGCYLLEIPRASVEAFKSLMMELELGWTWIGGTTPSGRLELRGRDEPPIEVETLARAWRSTLDW